MTPLEGIFLSLLTPPKNNNKKPWFCYRNKKKESEKRDLSYYRWYTALLHAILMFGTTKKVIYDFYGKGETLMKS